jgi:hypothetical protein
MKPDESLLKTHLGEAPYLSGCDAGKWGLVGTVEEIAWPHAVFWVKADERFVASGRIDLRFTLDGYPRSAPTSCPWNIETNSQLEGDKYPRVPGKFTRVFRTDWESGSALYAPCDRRAMTGHEPWKQQFPFWWWEAHFTIVKYLEFVHMVLNPIRLDNEAD